MSAQPEGPAANPRHSPRSSRTCVITTVCAGAQANQTAPYALSVAYRWLQIGYALLKISCSRRLCHRGLASRIAAAVEVAGTEPALAVAPCNSGLESILMNLGNRLIKNRLREESTDMKTIRTMALSPATRPNSFSEQEKSN
ncbi:hypothetical protein DM02DRAFT_657265 [Periconia macrospinosa]|uniref:Uncharacterized protein n=1 Tax=Periconia macrospinosa TaxID=97972 RepID=A0A2V1DLG7_9PLEO|nr:hypothetical protein DM02DRAFT_657265 [Periconia macrospinosa]